MTINIFDADEATRMDKMRWLQEYRALEAEVSKKKEKYERIRAACEKTTSIATGMPRGGSSARDELYAKMVDLAQELSADMGEMEYMREKVWGAVNAIQDRQLMALLTGRYLLGYSWGKIATDFSLPACTVRGRMHQRALDALHIV